MMDEDTLQLTVDKLQTAIESLVSVFSSVDESLRQSVRWSLVNIGEDTIPALAEALRRGNRDARWEAAKTLGEIGSPLAAPALVEGLHDDVFDIRWLASNGLIALGIRGLEPLMEALIENPDSARLKECAHHVVRVLVESDLREMLAPLKAALGDSKADVREAAESVLEELVGEIEDD